MKKVYISLASIISLVLLSVLAIPEQSFAVSSITVEKTTVPSGLDGFQFSFTGPGNNSQFTLADGGSQVFSDLEPGTYIVSELNLPEGFDLILGGSNQCGNSQVIDDEENATATIELGDNCDLTVGFVNRGNSVISIFKETIPTDDEQEFDFTSDLPGTENFTITSENGLTILSVPGGTFTFEEEITTGYTLTDIDCDDPGSSTDLEERTATIVIEANDNITCTFTNTANGTIIIEKITVPTEGEGFTFTENITGEDGTFTLDDDETQEFNNVPPGEYTVTEDDPIMTPGEFFLSDIVCDDMGSTTDLETRTATIDLDQEEVITCTFTNTTLLQGLNVIKTDSPDPVLAGQELTYEITIVNDADSEATDAVLVDVLPDGVIPVDIFSDAEGVECEFDIVDPLDPPTATCDIGTLLPDEELIVTIIVIPDPDVFDDAPVIIENKATLTAEPGSAVREATTLTLVNPIVDLEINTDDNVRTFPKGIGSEFLMM